MTVATCCAWTSLSRHLRTLRSAGLVTSRRGGKLVLYSVTATGRALPAAVLADAEPVL